MHQCDVMMNTGGRFRSYVLGVMSPARFLCATPVIRCSSALMHQCDVMMNTGDRV